MPCDHIGSLGSTQKLQRFDRLIRRLVLDPLQLHGGFEPAEFTPADLAGTPVPALDRATGAARIGVPGLRQALVEIDLTEPSAGPAPSVAELGRRVALADALYQACDYAGAVRLLPDLLRDLHTETAGPDHSEALRLLCDAASIASSVLRNLGYPADAWLAAVFRTRAGADLARRDGT